MNPAVGFSALVGLSIHTFFDGVSIASGFLVSVPLGFLIFCAVVLHKMPEGVTVASIALASGPRASAVPCPPPSSSPARRLPACWACTTSRAPSPTRCPSRPG